MNIYIDRMSGQTYITHENQSLRFNMGLYREGRTTKALAEAKDYFIVLDQFIDTLPEKEKNDLWLFYLNCKNALDDHMVISDIESILSNEIAKISSIITIDKLRSWYAYKSGIIIPADLKDSINDLPDPSLATVDQTYLRKDYIGLCALSMAMTLLSPVFSAYVEKTKGEHGTEWKTYYAYLLITKSEYYKSEELARLYRYVEVTLNSLVIRYDTIVLSGISKEEYPQWIMAVVMTKKVATGDITGDPTVPPLIKFIYKYIQQKVQSMEKDFHGRVRYRQIKKSGNSDDSEISPLEAYNTRQVITDNLVIICEHYLSDIEAVALKMDDTIPLSLLQESQSARAHVLSLLYSSDIGDGQIILLKWVLSKVIPPGMVDYLSRESIIDGIIAVRTYLWHKGYYDLAALISAVPIDNTQEHMVTGTDKRSRVVRDLSDKIDQIFPYYRKTTGVKKVKPQKSVQISAEYVESLLNKNDWYLTLPDVWLESALLGSTSRHYAINDDIRLNLIDLAIDIASNPVDRIF